MLVLSKDDITGLLSPQQLIDSVEAALRAQAAGLAFAPPRLHMDWRGSSWLTMPAAAESECGVKVVCVAPGNADLGLPTTGGVMILSDARTGVPLALLNAAALTSQRTGAVGALGVKYLTPRDISSVGIVGCGAQGAWQAICACAVRPIREIFCVVRSAAKYETFAATVQRYAPGVRLTPCRNVSELLDRTNLIIAATTSAEPVLPDEPRLLERKHFISVGSYKPTMQELPDAVFALAGLLAVDSEQARHETGDVINPLRKGILRETDVFSIAEFVTGQRIPDTARTTVYKSVGMALYDLFVAAALFREAKRHNIGNEINL